MSIPAVLAPVFVLVALAFGLLFLTGRRRFGAIRAGDVRIRDIALGERGWPEPALKAANAYQNQFELPVLFYALVALAILTRKADLVFVATSWLFVATRLAHAAVHVTSNDVRVRFRLFLAGVFVLMAMWILFAVRILAGWAP